MKTATVREIKAKLSAFLELAQGERVLITSHGKPVAMLTGVEGQDLTEVVREYDEVFAASLAVARKQPRTPIGDVRAELRLPPFVDKGSRPRARAKRALPQVGKRSTKPVKRR